MMQAKLFLAQLECSLKLEYLLAKLKPSLIASRSDVGNPVLSRVRVFWHWGVLLLENQNIKLDISLDLIFLEMFRQRRSNQLIPQQKIELNALIEFCIQPFYQRLKTLRRWFFQRRNRQLFWSRSERYFNRFRIDCRKVRRGKLYYDLPCHSETREFQLNP